ncbi:MAG: vWA domain-containing protein, partial [Methyloceanibacter sp.]
MRGKRCAALWLALFPAALLGAAVAGAEDAPAPPADTPRPATIFVLDGSSGMDAKIGDTSKLEVARAELGQAVSSYGDRLSFGLVAFGHRKAANCADTETLAKPGELTSKTQSKLLDIKPQGQAPIAAALSDAVKAAPTPDGRLDIVLIASGGDNCDADICAMADALKVKSPAIRIHAIGLDAKAEELKPLACATAATGGEFVAATEASTFKQGLATVLDVIANPAPIVRSVATVTINAPDGAGAEAAPAGSEQDAPADGQAVEPGQSAVQKSASSASHETAVNKSETAAPSQPMTLAQRAAPPKPAAPQKPVPVTFKAMVTEIGPKVQSGLTWRVYSSQASPDGGYKLISTHREAMPTAALLPGEYMVNAAYGLSNLTKKVKVEGGRSIEETFILNTGGLKLAAVLANGEKMSEQGVRFDIMSDEEDQFGNRATILGDAKPGVVVRLNAGAYHVVSLYGDANATVRADVTVEPGKITEATVKHNGAKITFRLVQSLGGEALADTKWTILTSAGDMVKENAGALPTHILAAGSYAVVADHNGLSFTRKFSIEAGETKQIEVAVADGPTSPEALKALMDPPEPPPPAAGTYAGDGAPGTGLGFDGFSARPADPNA